MTGHPPRNVPPEGRFPRQAGIPSPLRADQG